MTRRNRSAGWIAAIASWLSVGIVLGADAQPWIERGRPNRNAQQAVELLVAAASHGLDPNDYDAGSLWQDVTLAATGPAPEPATLARLDQALGDAMRRYLTHLHSGRVDPRRFHPGFPAAPPDPFDAATTLRAALAAGRLREAVADAVPRVPLYERLRAALAHYRNLADTAPGWHEKLPPLPAGKRAGAGKLEPGQSYSGLVLLAQRLGALGDLPLSAPAAAVTYDGPLVEAVVAFQRRHGLAPDGVIGKETLAQLSVAPRARVRQLELALERLRWTPLLSAPRMIVVNIPEFVLRAYEVDSGSVTVRAQMKVIVGKALDTRTPLIGEVMRSIEFQPYWNVPASIVRDEILPRLRRDPGFFEREGFELVGVGGRVISVLSTPDLDALRAGALRLRQRPGPRNPLGDIKFVFPNREHIYLHHTPSTRLFERERRDFSHGCIRVENPVALARFVLQREPDWTEQRIVRAMTADPPRTLSLTDPVPVLIAYSTALVKGGVVHFFADLYGHDRTLDARLRSQRAGAAQSAR